MALAGNEPLRVCKACGLEARTQDDLKLFVKQKMSRHGKENRCLKCRNEHIGKWRRNNPKYTETQRRSKERRITVRTESGKYKRITLPENPRTKICSGCGRGYPEDLQRQTSMHHDEYDLNHPLTHTRELCDSCHNKDRARKEPSKAPSGNEQRKGK